MKWDQKTLEKFVTLWQTKTVTEVAEAIGIGNAYASAKAMELRSKGVALRSHRARSADYAALAEVAKNASKTKK